MGKYTVNGALEISPKSPDKGGKETKEKETKEEEETQKNKVKKSLETYNSKLKIFFTILSIVVVYLGCSIAVYYANGGKINFNF